MLTPVFYTHTNKHQGKHMILWNLILIVLVILTLMEAHANGWKRPQLVSVATIAALWIVGSYALWLVS